MVGNVCKFLVVWLDIPTLWIISDCGVSCCKLKPLNSNGITVFGFTTLANKTDTVPCSCMTVVLRLDNSLVTDF